MIIREMEASCKYNDSTGEWIVEINAIMKISSILSEIPGWHDPELPGFLPPKDWTGARVRVRVPIKLDPAKELAEAARDARKKYPGAIVSAIPDYLVPAVATEDRALRGGDAEVLRRFLVRGGLVFPPGSDVESVAASILAFLPSARTSRGVRLIEVSGENVLSFERVDAWNLDRKGLTMIVGKNFDWEATESNGSGKSSLVTLPFLAWFGRTFKGQTHDAWAKRNSTKKAVVRAKAALADGRVLAVERSRRPGGLKATLDGADVAMGTPDATQRAIEELLGLSWDVVTNAVYVGQRELGSVFGTEKERKELFARFLGHERFAVTQKKLKAVAEAPTREVFEIESEIESARRRFEEAVEGEIEIEIALAAAPQEKHAPGELLRESSDLRGRAGKLLLKNTEAEDWLVENQARFEKLLFAELESDARRDDLRKKLAKLAKTGSTICEACGAKIDVESLERHSREIEEKIDAEILEGQRFHDLREENRARRKRALEKVQKRNAEAKILDDRAAAFDRQIEVEDVQRENREKLAELLAKSQERRAKTERSIRVHERAAEFAREEREFWKFCAEVVGRDGLPAYLCELVAPELNRSAQKFSEIFAAGEIGVAFAFSNGDVDVSVANPRGGATTKDQSAGEMRMAAIIAVMSFCDVLVPVNLLVLDEPSDGLDGAAAEAFAKGLSAIVERFEHVVVITHNEKLRANLEPDWTVRVEKRDGTSSVVGTI